MDPNYDPSDFLMAGLPMCNKPQVLKVENNPQIQLPLEESNITEMKIHDDLAVSDSDDESKMMSSALPSTSQTMVDDDDVGDGDLWF